MADCFAQRVDDLLAETSIDKSEIALIGSHGQTVSERPHWKLGDISVIVRRTGITVAGDFCAADVATGGNGTPALARMIRLCCGLRLGNRSGEFA